MSEMQPYSKPSSTNLSDLTIETDQDELIIYGNASFPKTQKGLEDAKRLAAIMNKAVQILESNPLPSENPKIPDFIEKPNPFS